MTERKLYPDGDWLFTSDAGKVTVDGRVYMPALLRLDLSRKDATDLLQVISYFLSIPDRERHLFIFSGSIERLQDDPPSAT